MKYQFCYGPSGAGKSRYLQELVLQEAAGELADFAAMTGCGEPGFSNYLYVVPEQYTMQTQKDLVSRAACRGIMNVDVLSFGRLAHRIFEETGEDGRAVLDDVGKSLILRRLAGKYRKDLAVIGSRIDSLGMISEVKSQISEFMQYDLSPEDVEKLSAYAGAKGQGALAARLKDLEVLYRAFLEDGKDRFVTGEETYDILAEAIPKSQLVRSALVRYRDYEAEASLSMAGSEYAAHFGAAKHDIVSVLYIDICVCIHRRKTAHRLVFGKLFLEPSHIEFGAGGFLEFSHAAVVIAVSVSDEYDLYILRLIADVSYTLHYRVIKAFSGLHGIDKYESVCGLQKETRNHAV